MRPRPSIALSFVFALSAICTPDGPASAQTVTIEYSRRADVIYGRKFGLALTLEILTPSKANGVGVIWVVSSNGTSSREQTLQPSFETRMGPLLERGYTIFAVIHSNAPAFQVQDYVQDVRRAVRFVRNGAAKFGVDPQRLAIVGSSSGGLIALMVAMAGQDGDAAAADLIDRESSRVQAVGSLFAPTDLVNFGETSQNIVDLMKQGSGKVDPSFQFYEVDAKSSVRMPVTGRESVLRLLRELSPVTHVTADDPPTILIHGDQDKAVPVQQSRQLIARLNEAKVTARLVVRERAGHAWPGWEADSKLIAEWFDTHLRRVR